MGFWALRKKDKWYGFENLCPWDRQSLEWDGLCTHSALEEPVYALVDITPEHAEEEACST